jgi:phosphoglycerol transferase MdoB-like AlkP superfamily enzyme
MIFIFFSEGKYRKPWGYIIEGLLVLAFCYVSFFNTIFDEYGSVVPEIVRYFLLYKFVSFTIRLLIPSVRDKWRACQFYLLFFIYVFCILLNAICEYVFWNEFGVRYNFIAVDYLIYTNEVIGNIVESYPVVPMFTGLLIISLGISYILLRKQELSFSVLASFKTKMLVTGTYIILFIISCGLLNFNLRFQQAANVYVNELQANGLHRFYLAFLNSELQYDEFYITLPKNKAMAIIHKEYGSSGNNLQIIKDSLPEVHKNIILITVESLSASFLNHYGNAENITPYLDKLMDESLVFDNMYATGNRTVRGLEAVTLCLPPSPGESIVKRANNSDLFSTGKVLKEKGYIVQYLYGGDSYFDNMETFFSGNGYEVIDKKSFTKDEITFSNIWGVCDEDMYNKAIKVFNSDTKTGKPFFGHIMTVSNHRPFTYPQGKIDIPNDSKTRNGGVKYTDYAIGRFIEMARQQSWFNNTIFIITADHCASSAGKTEIPLDKYHIPAMIYAPGYIKPRQVNTLVSQIDIMPTLFGLMHFSYNSYFYGKDIFSPDYKSRVLVATYQNLGYWENNIFTILSPVRKVEQYRVKQNDNYQFELIPLNQTDTVSLNQAISNYQTIGY